jgi:hypothetical protein
VTLNQHLQNIIAIHFISCRLGAKIKKHPSHTPLLMIFFWILNKPPGHGSAIVPYKVMIVLGFFIGFCCSFIIKDYILYIVISFYIGT